jgi:ferritin-like metal-binding protein YciE
MATIQDQLLDWLRDAHAMEVQAETMLKGQAARVQHYPKLKARIEQHLEETREQARLVAQCIEQLGGSPSTLKDASGRMSALGQAFAGMMADDEVVKGSMFSYAFEHMEIAAYRILIATAHAAGEAQIKGVCERILPEEEAMAAWIEQHAGELVQQYLARLETPELEAKR